MTATKKLRPDRAPESIPFDKPTRLPKPLYLMPKTFKPPEVRVLTVCDIIAVVCSVFGVSLGEFESTCRHPRVVAARRATVHLAREHTTASYPEIASAMGRPNHSTIIDQHNDAKDLLDMPEKCAARKVVFADGEKDIGDLIERARAMVQGEPARQHTDSLIEGNHDAK